MAIDAGSVFVRLGAHFTDDGFDKYDRALDQARKRKAVEAKLGGDFQPKAFNAYEKALKDAHGRANRRDAFKAELGADYHPAAFRQYEKALKDAEHHNDRMARSQGRLRTGFGAVWGRGGAAFAAAGGVYGLVKAVKFANDEFEESAKVTAQTAVVIKSTGGAAKVTAKEVEGLSSALSVKAGIDDEVIQRGENLLLTFTNVRNEAGKGNDVFSQATRIMTDMSVALDQDVKSSAIQLGKALNDPIKGVTALQRVGVSFTKDQKEQIKTLVESGRSMDAQKLILRELNKEFKGSAEAQARPMDKLKVAVGNLAETVGGKLAPYLTRAADKLSKFIGEMDSGTGSGGKFVRKLKEIWEEAKPIVTWLGRAAANVGKFADHHRTVTKLAVAIGAAGLAINAIKTSKAVSGIGTLLGALRKLAKTKAGEQAATEIVDGIGGVPGKGNKKLGRVRTWMKSLFGSFGRTAGGAAADNTAGAMYAGTDGAFKARAGKFKTIFTRMGGWFGIIAAAALAIEMSKGLDSALRSWIDKNTTGTANKTGHGILDGIKRLGDPFGNATRPSGGAHAAGGIVTTPWQIVGEEGPELAQLPMGTRVHTASQTKKMLGGGLNMKGQLEQEAREAQKGSKLVAAALTLVPTEAKKHGKKTGKNLTDEIKSGTADATARVKKFRGDVGDHLDDLAADGKKKVRKFSRSVTDGISDAKDAGEKHLRRLERVADQRLGAVAAIGKSRSGQFSRSVARSMGTTDSAVFTGLSYVSSATSEALKAFDAKPISLSVPRPKGIPGHATGGIPNPGSGARDDHMLVSPDGRPVAALSGTEGIINTPQMGVIDHALAVAKAVGASAFGGLGELWGSGMRHFAGGGILGRANALERMHLPYVWGGHHGDRGPIRNPHPGLDCSSAVSYVLGIPPRVSSGFMNYGKPGRGKVSILSNPTHAYMVINGRAFGTSGENPGGGAGWIDSYTYRSGFSVRHVDGELGSTDIPKVSVRGTAGGMRSLAQAAINRVRKGATGAVDKAASALDDPFGQPLQEGAGNYLSTSYGPPWGGIQGGGVTATGIDLRGAPHRHIVAVDPSRIKLGSSVRVTPNPFGYSGAFLAGDTGGAIKGNRLDFYDWRGRRAQNAWGKRLVNVTAAARGGQLRRFAGGGPLNRIVDRASKRVKGLKNRIKGFPDQIDILEGRYHRLENDYARPGQDDEDYVIPATATSPARIDDRAIARRTGQLDQLVSLRRKITMLYQREAKAMKQMIETYKAAIRRARAAMRGAKSKDRPNYVKSIRSMQAKIGAIRHDRTDVLNTESDQYLDLRELRAERKGLRGSADSALAEIVGSTEGGDTSTGDVSNPDLDAQLAQANERIRVLQETVRVSQANLGALSGPGDIGTSGSSSALQAAYADALLPVGAGQVGMQSPVASSPTINIYTLHPGDPATLRAVADASNSGNSLSGYVPAPRETTGV